MAGHIGKLNCYNDHRIYEMLPLNVTVDTILYDIKWRSNKVSNVIIVKKTHTKSSVEQHGPSTKTKTGSGAMEE